jgi:superoxide reductase
MTGLKQVYKCNVCGNIVEVLHTGEGEPVCCGQPKVLARECKSSAEMGHN